MSSQEKEKRKVLNKLSSETAEDFTQRIKNFTDAGWQLISKTQYDAWLTEPLPIVSKAEDYCGAERPPRKVLCQLPRGHKGSHRAIIFWEDE